MSLAGRVRRRLRRRLRRLVPASRRAATRGAREPERGGRSHLDYVFVVTYGRSGSTLVQGLLNALPGVVVRGENSLFVLQIYRAWTQARDFRELHRSHRPRKVQSAFYGIRDLQLRHFVQATRTLMTRFLLGSSDRAEVDVLGFKEVLWHEVTPEETEGFFDFMDRTFPRARYVLNQRDPEQVVTSGFWRRQDGEEALAAIHRVEQIQAYLASSRPDRTLVTRYERLTHDDPEVSDPELRGLAEFVVGRCDDTLLESLRQTMAIGFGPKAFGASKGR